MENKGIRTVIYRVVGISPILMHNPEGTMKPRPKGGMRRDTGPPPPEEEAKAGLYVLPSNQLYIKSEAFHGSIMTAASKGSYKFRGPTGRPTAAKPILAAMLEPSDWYFPLIHPESGEAITATQLEDGDTTGLGYRIDVRRAVIQGNGVMRARGRIDQWCVMAEFLYDADVINLEDLTTIFTYAGKVVGVLDQRPGSPKTPGRFGRYSVELVAE